MSERVNAALRRDVAQRARYRCEYCGMPDAEAIAPHEPDHIIAVQHGGKTNLDNLAYACFDCNHIKGSYIASRDPATGELTPLFNPRTDLWTEHFQWHGAVAEPLTPIGRATAFLLRFNDSIRVEIRENLLRQGRY